MTIIGVSNRTLSHILCDPGPVRLIIVHKVQSQTHICRGIQRHFVKNIALRCCHSQRRQFLQLRIKQNAPWIRIYHKLPTPQLILFRRQFHTTGRRNALPPFIWVFVSYLSKITVALTGRKWRNWLKKQPHHVQIKHHKGIMAMFLSLGSLLVAFSGFYYYAHQQVTPIIGKKKFITVTRDQYMKVAEFETEGYLADYKDKTVPATDPIYGHVINVALRLVNANMDLPGMKDHKWTIHIVKSEEKNAFVLPNGHIFVFTGLLEFMENADQFGVVLGHEMAHALLLHAAQQLSFVQFVDWFIIFGMAAIWLLLPNDGIAVVANWFYKKVTDLTVRMPYSRELEAEADYVGLHLAAKACFDVREGAAFWSRMTIADDIKGEERRPEWLSTHPTHDNRVKNLNQLMEKALKLRDGCNCPRLPTSDPRVRIGQLREATNNVLRARGSNVNLQSIEKLKLADNRTQEKK